MEIITINNISLSLGIFGLTFWTLFILRKLLGFQYKPYVKKHKASVAVVIPAYNEDPKIIEQVYQSIKNNNPEEIIVVFNGDNNGYKQFKHKAYNLRNADKRDAMAYGVKKAGDVDLICFVDSDTLWEINTLEELKKPFANKDISGVATHQIIDNDDASVWTSIGSWLTHQGLTTGSAFQSVKNCTSCLRGRTACYRKNIFDDTFLKEFTNEIFLGMRCRSGDDGRLTFLTLKRGYGTFLQSTAVVHTELKEKMMPYLKFRARCHRNTYRRYFSAITKKWFWKMNWRFKIEFIASVIIPLGFIIAVTHFMLNIIQLNIIYSILIFCWFMTGRMIRSPYWIKEKPKRILIFPALVMAFLFPLMIVKWYALFTLKDNNWGTR